MRTPLLLALLLVLPSLSPNPSLAAPGTVSPGQIEVSPFLGGYRFDEDAGFDRDRPVFGARVGYFFSREIAAELSLEGLGAHGDESGRSGNFFEGHLDALYHLETGTAFRPFLAAGAGLARYQGGDRGDTEWDGLANYGIGAKFFLTDRLALRADVRQPLTFGPLRMNLLYTLGVSYLFGGPSTGVASAERKESGTLGAAEPPPPSRSAPSVAAPGAGASPAAPAQPGSANVAASKQAPPPSTGAAEAAPSAPVIPGNGLSQAGGELARIHFDFDQARLTDEARSVLEQNFQALRTSPSPALRVEGHCDERGTTEYNLALGEARARTAAQYLAQKGFSEAALQPVSYGREQPLDPGHNDRAWSLNRRAEFVRLDRGP